MKPTKNVDYAKLDTELKTYCYAGYDIHFLHGWFCAYLYAPSDSEEDLLIPDYLIVDEDKIKDEVVFSKIVDNLVELYSVMADSLYEQNKPIKPLIDINKPAFFDPLLFDANHKINLIKWLYGYLAGFVVIGLDVSEVIPDDKLLDEKFFPALFTLCIALFALDREIAQVDKVDEAFKVDYKELLEDLKAMWESEDNEADVDEQIANAIEHLDLMDVNAALNDIFYVVRRSDEIKNADADSGKLLNKLITKH